MKKENKKTISVLGIDIPLQTLMIFYKSYKDFLEQSKPDYEGETHIIYKIHKEEDYYCFSSDLSYCHVFKRKNNKGKRIEVKLD